MDTGCVWKCANRGKINLTNGGNARGGGAFMLDIQHLSFAVTNEAAGKEILLDITLTVDSGRFVVITGPNGGGK